MSLNPVLMVLDQGSAAFAPVWRAWLSQFTQPQLLKLSEAYLQGRLFHSSQMGGFATRKLREPGPRVFLAVGYFNVAHAHALGLAPDLIETVPDIGLPEKLAGTRKDVWEGREPFRDASRLVLGPTGLFEAFTGLRDLSQVENRHIPPEHVAEACRALGRWLRLHLAAQGIDWLTELPALRQSCDCIEELLMGQTVAEPRLLAQLTKLAALANTTDIQLWQVISSTFTT